MVFQSIISCILKEPLRRSMFILFLLYVSINGAHGKDDTRDFQQRAFGRMMALEGSKKKSETLEYTQVAPGICI